MARRPRTSGQPERWHCGNAGPESEALDAIERGGGLELVRIVGTGDHTDVHTFDLVEVLVPELRRRLRREPMHESERAVVTGVGVRHSDTAELLRRAIAVRQEVIAIADRERRAGWVLEQAARLGDSLETDGVRLAARRQIDKARRASAEARARAFRFEALAHLSRLGLRPAEVEHSVRAALDATIWSEAWAELAASGEAHPTEVVFCWQVARNALSIALRTLLVVPLRADPASRTARTRAARKLLKRLPWGWGADTDSGDQRALKQPAAGEGEDTDPETDSDSDADWDTDDEDGLLPLPPPVFAGTHPNRGLAKREATLSPAASWGMVLGAALSGVRAGPSFSSANAWCAICGASYQLPPGTPVLKTFCGVCHQNLIPHNSECPHVAISTRLVVQCPNCGDRLQQLTSHRHLRCPACRTAVAPLAIAPLE